MDTVKNQALTAQTETTTEASQYGASLTVDLNELSKVSESASEDGETAAPTPCSRNLAHELVYKTHLEDPPDGFLIQADSYLEGSFVRGADCLTDGKGKILAITIFDRDPDNRMTIDMYDFAKQTYQSKRDDGNEQQWTALSSMVLNEIPGDRLQTVIDATKLRITVV